MSQEALKTLLEKRQGPCVSIFMPTFRTGTEIQQNQIRLRNLLRTAEEKLQAAGLRPAEGKALLEPAQALTGNVLFWKRQSDGLALFLAADLFQFFCLPESFAESVVTADRFHITPLLPVLRGDKRFYILTLSQKEVRLLEGTDQHIQEVELDAVPKSLEEALQHDEFGKQIRFRSGAGGGDRSAMVSGHGAEIEDTKDNLLRYFRLIDRGLHDLLRGEQAPLILAGVDYLFPIYREANTYAHLLAEGIPGNPKGTPPDSLQRAALKIVGPYFQRAEADAIAQYRQSSGTGLTSANLPEIVAAAGHGRVGLLLMTAGGQMRGRYDRESGAVEMTPAGGETGEDLLEIAAVETFLNGGRVFVLPPEKMPGGGAPVAVFRY
jgi:hypothetical protein